MPKNTLNNHHKKQSIGYHIQTIVVVLITIVMFFPLYWMIATSLKSAEESQLIIQYRGKNITMVIKTTTMV